ncbi:MAG: dihydroneopterin aldolase [Chloroflexi bacterium]|nr:dihydroneopterin aldolase [Chloroflexota bacterium]
MTLPDRIILEGLTFYGYHGVHPEERTLGQRFVVDVSIEADLRRAGETDDLGQTVSYSAVVGVVRRVVEGASVQLIETLAERIARTILAECGGRTVRVRVAKPWAPIQGTVAGTVAVEITRGAED